MHRIASLTAKLVVLFVAILISSKLCGQDLYAMDLGGLSKPGEGPSLQSTFFEESSSPISDLFSYDANGSVSKKTNDTVSVVKKKSDFAARNTGAFKSKKKGGTRSPGMAALCSALLPGLGQFYNGQWYKPPVIYAGAAVIAYFVDMNIKERKVYDKELKARHEFDSISLNPDLAAYSKENLLEIRNYYEQNFELTLIIAGVVYLLNIVDAVVYAHLFDFNVSPNLSMRIEPYAAPNFSKGNSKLPLDMGIKMCLTLK